MNSARGFNEDRSRFYGIRIGDRVVKAWLKPKNQVDQNSRDFVPPDEGTVMMYGVGDNNCVYVLWDGKSQSKAEVAEWLEVLKKVEDR